MNILSKAARLARTLWYVPPRQIAARLRYRALTYVYRLPVYSFFLPEPAELDEWFLTPPVLNHGNAEEGHHIAEGLFTFNAQTEHLGIPVNWYPSKASALWVFHLHYHEWLTDLRAAGNRTAAQALVQDWLLACDSWHPVAWHPYPTSLRIVSWLTHGKWLLEGADTELSYAFHTSLHRQITHLSRNLEEDLGANHLLKNLKALIYAGTCIPAFSHVVMPTMARLLRELEVQILPDGTHYERTPLYHKQVLKDLVETQALLTKAGNPSPYLAQILPSMAAALKFFTYPNGDLALLNDSARGTPAQTANLMARVEGLETIAPPMALPHAGVSRLERGSLTLLFDHGPIGPDAIPGHAHADTLNIELMLGTEWVVVNGGTFGYQHKKRNLLRSTPAHSTVSVEGADMAEVWSAFRVGRRPTATEGGHSTADDGSAHAWGEHDGYRFLGVSRLRRTLTLSTAGNTLTGADTAVTRHAKQRFTAHFHLHPGCTVKLISQTEADITTPRGRKLRLTCQTPSRLDVKDSLYCPQFGVEHPTKQLQVVGRTTRQGGQLDWTWTLLPTT